MITDMESENRENGNWFLQTDARESLPDSNRPFRVKLKNGTIRRAIISEFGFCFTDGEPHQNAKFSEFDIDQWGYIHYTVNDDGHISGWGKSRPNYAMIVALNFCIDNAIPQGHASKLAELLKSISPKSMSNLKKCNLDKERWRTKWEPFYSSLTEAEFKGMFNRLKKS